MSFADGGFIPYGHTPSGFEVVQMHGLADDEVLRYGRTLVVSPHTARMLVHDYNPHDELDGVRAFYQGLINRRFNALARRFRPDIDDRRTIIEDRVRRALGDDWAGWTRPGVPVYVSRSGDVDVAPLRAVPHSSSNGLSIAIDFEATTTGSAEPVDYPLHLGARVARSYKTWHAARLDG